MKRTLLATALVASALSFSTIASAAAISGLSNTGVGAGGAGDTHYKLTAVTSDTTLTSNVPVITLDNVWPISPWMANSSVSKWITPTSSQGQSFDASSNGSYTYSLDFNLSGYQAATAAFTGRVAADNSVTILLNNQVIGNGSGFTDWSSFSANSGFVSGANRLDFVVSNWAQNSGNPTGLRVQFDSSTVMAAVPEPETYAMMLGGLGLIGAIARRRRQPA